MRTIEVMTMLKMIPHCSASVKHFHPEHSLLRGPRGDTCCEAVTRAPAAGGIFVENAAY